MKKYKQDFEMYSGDTKYLEISVYSECSELVDIAGAKSISWTVRSSYKSNDPVIEKSLNNGISFGSLGIIIIRLNGDDTKLLSGNYYHDCSLTDAVNNISTVLTGVARFIKKH